MAHEDWLSAHENLYKSLALRPNVFCSRLLTILPGQGSDEIRCRLKVASLSATTSYEALSYTWGDLKDVRLITVNGVPFPVTANLEGALQALRRSDEKRVIWVDAICIHQLDLAERAAQILEMGQIFKNAYQVIVWLGEGNDDSRRALREASIIHDLVELSRLEQRNTITPYLEVLRASSDRFELIRGLQELLRRRWWTRVWVVQEFTMASGDPRVTCGDDSIPWTHFSRMISVLTNFAEQFSEFRALISRVREMQAMRYLVKRPPRLRDFSAVNDDWTLLEDDLFLWLRRTSLFEATNPCDKLFALIGLTRSRLWSQIKVDYTRPATLLTRDLLQHVIDDKQSLDMLALCYPNRPHDQPSWLPELTSPGLPSLRSLVSARHHKHSSLEGNAKRQFQSLAILAGCTCPEYSWCCFMNAMPYLTGTSKCTRSHRPDGDDITCRGYQLGIVETVIRDTGDDSAVQAANASSAYDTARIWNDTTIRNSVLEQQDAADSLRHAVWRQKSDLKLLKQLQDDWYLERRQQQAMSETAGEEAVFEQMMQHQSNMKRRALEARTLFSKWNTVWPALLEPAMEAVDQPTDLGCIEAMLEQIRRDKAPCGGTWQPCKWPISWNVNKIDLEQMEAITSAMYGRYQFVMHNGLLGMGPYDLVEGDVIVKLCDSSFAYALRRHGGHHRLVGAVYVSPPRDDIHGYSCFGERSLLDWSKATETTYTLI